MVAGFEIGQIATAKILYNGTVKAVSAMWLNGQQVWPQAITYVITSASVVYSKSSIYPGVTLNYITAKGTKNGVVDNYATIIGTVEKRRGSTVLGTYTNVSLTPVNSSGTSVFFIVGNQVQGYSLDSTVKSLTSVQFGAKYVDNEGVESALYNVTINQQENKVVSTVDTITAIGVGINITGANFGVPGGSGTLSATKVFSRVTTYTSTYVYTDAGRTSDISGDTTYTTSGSGATINNRTMTVSSRKHTEVAGSWIVTGSYVDSETTYTGTLNVTQTSDIKNSETRSGTDYNVTIGATLDTISAAGGSCTLNWGGKYTLVITQYWQSDKGEPTITTHSNVDISRELFVITESGNTAGRFHRSTSRVTHDNMGTNEVTDTVTYTASVVIEGVTEASNSVSLSATNSKGTPVVSEHFIQFAIEASPDSFDAEGGTSTLTGREYYAIYYDYTWTSGATSRKIDTRNRNVTSSTSFDVTPTSGCSLFRNILEIETRTEQFSKTWTVVGTWNGYTAYATITQEGAIIKKEISISAVQSGYNVYATASSPVHSNINVYMYAFSTPTHEDTFTVTIRYGSRESTPHTLSFKPYECGISELSPASDTYANYVIN